MKKIYKSILALFTLSLAVLSCEDAIDIRQPGLLDAANAYQSVSDLNNGLLGAYNFLDTTSEIGFTAAFTDEAARGRDNGGQNFDELNHNINASNGYAFNIWQSNYAAIGMANSIISASASIDRSEDPTLFDNVVGQAYAIRAYAHFQILTYFSTDYTNDAALAGMLLTAPNSNTFGSVARSTNGEFYTQIEEDLTMASGLISSQSTTTMGQDFITALRARMAAYRGDYVTADTHAASLLGSYPIANQTQYTNMYDDTDETEVIFSLTRSIGDPYDGQGTAGGGWAGSLFAFIDASAGGGPFMEVSRSVFNILDGTADVRLSRNVNLAESTVDAGYATNPNFLNDDVLLVFKYPGGTQPLLNNLKVFRSSEMLMIRAEAAVAAGDLAGAAGYVKQLQDARYGFAQALPNYVNATEAYGAILDERRLEFLFEGHRWVDLKRLGDLGNRSIDRDATECANFAVCTASNTDHRFTLPIPQAELTANSAAEQNPGY